MMMSRLLKNRKGQSIIEAMVAVSVLLVGLLGVVHLTTVALSEERGIADNFRASYLASEGTEIARNIIDGNYLVPGRPWNTGFNCGSGCQTALDYLSTDLSRPCDAGVNLNFDAASGLYSYGAGTPTPFNRCVIISAVNANEVQVQSIVSWTVRGGNSRINVEDHFFNWRPN